MIKEDGRVSEQTFAVSVSFGDPGSEVRPASLQQNLMSNFDYVVNIPGNSIITREFGANESELTIPFTLQPDEIPEGTEGFRISIASQGSPYPNFHTTVLTIVDTLVRIIDDECKLLKICYWK